MCVVWSGTWETWSHSPLGCRCTLTATRIWLLNHTGAVVKITNISTAVIEGNFDWVLVRVDTDAGVSGLGEAYWGVGVAELVHKAKPLLLGTDPFDIAKHIEVMIRCLSGEGSQGGATVTAISGIEIALWDLVGRALKTPIYNLFGGRFRNQIRIYADCHAGLEE